MSPTYKDLGFASADAVKAALLRNMSAVPAKAEPKPKRYLKPRAYVDTGKFPHVPDMLRAMLGDVAHGEPVTRPAHIPRGHWCRIMREVCQLGYFRKERGSPVAYRTTLPGPIPATAREAAYIRRKQEQRKAALLAGRIRLN
jgi:hypothetical protein